MMKTTFKEENTDFVMYFEGRLDTAAAPQTEREVQVLTDCTGHNIILDCNKLEYISSSGLRILLGILKGAKASGSKVTLRDVNDDIKSVLQLTGFISIFEFELH
jgi:anti-anti-sigma factor